MKIEMVHPNGDIHEYDLDRGNALQVEAFLSDIEFETGNGGAEWLGIYRKELPKPMQEEAQKRVSIRLDTPYQEQK